jgi:hypothetical protein
VGDDEPFGHLPEEDDVTGTADADPLLPPALADDEEPERIDAAHLRRIPHRYRRSLGASALAAGMLGLRDIIEGPKDDNPVVEQFQGEDDVDRPVEVHLDPDDPAASVVRLRNVDGR